MLAAQHAAIYAYSVIGVRLGGGQAAQARSLQEAHRDTRDAAMADLAGRGVAPVQARPSYSPAAKATDDAGAQRWALQLEEAVSAGYRFLLAASATASADQSELRRGALAGLSTAAENAVAWRVLLTPATPTVPFPGA